MLKTSARARLHCTPALSILVRGLLSTTWYPRAASTTEVRCTCPHPVLCAPHRLIARSSHLLVFCALTRVLSDGTARFGSVFGVELFAMRPRSRPSFARAAHALRQREPLCAAGLPSLNRCQPTVVSPYSPSLVPSQSRHSGSPLSQRLSPGASGAWAAIYERQCRLCGCVARLSSSRAARPRRSCASYLRPVRARVVPNDVSSDHWCAKRLVCALIYHSICVTECGKRREVKIQCRIEPELRLYRFRAVIPHIGYSTAL